VPGNYPEFTEARSATLTSCYSSSGMVRGKFSICLEKVAPMKRLFDPCVTEAFSAAPWLFEPGLGDVSALLSQALGADWTVEREIDCEGHVSIIALPEDETDGTPSFILYEKDGLARVATVKCDEWVNDWGFDSFLTAVYKFIAEALASAGGR
jgi:hypothetical protein